MGGGWRRRIVPSPLGLRGGGGGLSPFSLADGGVPCKAGGAALPPGPASVLRVAAEPRLSDRAGRGRDAFFFPPQPREFGTRPWKMTAVSPPTRSFELVNPRSPASSSLFASD